MRWSANGNDDPVGLSSLDEVLFRKCFEVNSVVTDQCPLLTNSVRQLSFIVASKQSGLQR